MSWAVTSAAGLALGVATTGAFFDWTRGEIPNWLTLPPLVLSPFVYGLAFGIEHALHSAGAAILSVIVPYFLFRRGAMGGGDVKLFGGLGAITGFDLLAGIEIQLVAFVAALVFACAALAWKGVLLHTLGNALTLVRWRREASIASCEPIRLGGAIFVATGVFAAPYLLLAWSAR
jgi:prepilin peptidase CpaA